MSGKIIVAVTGEIGVGKTTFVKEFEKFDCNTIYSDEIAHKVLKYKRVKSKLQDYFGNDIFRGQEVIPERLAKKAFRNREAWQELIYITHKPILRRIFEIIAKSRKKFYIIDAPLLFESNLNEYCDYIVLLKTRPGLRKKRIAGKLKWSELKKRSSFLIPLYLKENLADFVVYNNQSKRRLMKNAQEIWTRIQNK